MARYTTNEATLESRTAKARKKNQEAARKQTERAELQLSRRKLFAQLYEPSPCQKFMPDGSPCIRYSIPGGFFCIYHGGDPRAAREAGKMRLLALVEPALRVMRRALASNNEDIAVKAASLILDRAGFGPKATFEIQEKSEDISNLSREELIERGQMLLRRISMLQEANTLEQPVIDITSETVN